MPRFGPLAAAVALAFGIALAPALDRLGIPPGARWALVALCLLGVRRAPPLIVAAVVAAGSARGGATAIELPPGIIADDATTDRIVGRVEGPVIRTAHGTGARVGDVWVWADEVLRPGDRIAATGLVRTDRDRLALSARTIEHLGEDLGLAARAWRLAAEIQAGAVARIDAAGGDPAARAALRGIVIGDRSQIAPALDDRWRAAGIFHVLSVSGLHLAVVAGLVFAVLRRAIAASWWGGRVHPARWAAPPSLVFAIGYTLVTGAQIATVRALIVIALVLVAAMLDRPLRLVDALGAAAIAILAWHPSDLADPSFQLSFVAALTLALRPAPEAQGGRIRRWLVHGVTTSVWIAITTAPLTAFHFQQVSAGGVIGNLVLTPLVELIALPLALAGILLGSLGTPLVWLATQIVSLVDGAAGALAPITPVGHIAVATATTMGILVVISLWLATRPRRTHLDLVVWGALCAGWALARTPPAMGTLRVTFVDVGQGDAAIVELPDGAVWLVDAGGNASARTLAAAARPGAEVTRVLAAYGHERVDLAILSHPHPDHYLGLAAIGVPITELWSAAEVEPAAASRGALPSFTDLAQALGERGTTTRHPPLGLVRAEAGVTLEILAPRYERATLATADPVRSVNDNSIVIAIEYRGRRIVLAGDIEREGEDALVEAGLARADVVKVPHHGSPTSSSAALVAALHPALAVISCGRANAFGFPSPAVVARWTAAGARVARTDRDGTIVVVVDASGGLVLP